MKHNLNHTFKRPSPPLLFVVCFMLLSHAPPTDARTSNAAASIPTVRINGAAYLSLDTLAKTLQGRLRRNPLKQKTELRLGGHTFVFTLFSSVITLNEVAYRLPLEVQQGSGTALYVPAEAFLYLLRRTAPEQPSLTAGPPTELLPPTPLTDLPFEPKDRPIPPPQPVKIDPTRWTLDTIIIDPGHGGKDPGTVGRRGTKEKDIVLPVAKRLKTLLEKQLRVQTVLTRDDDTFIPLKERAAIARRNHGKLFISLHCNAGKNRKAQGIEVYFLSDAKTDEAAEVAKRENAVLRYEEKNTAETNDELEGIQFGLLSTQFLKESQDLADEIRTEIVQQLTGLKDRGVRQANFYVMRGTMGDMPSVLVEMGFLSHSSEENRLRSRAFQKNMAEAIFRGILKFKHRYEQQLTQN